MPLLSVVCWIGFVSFQIAAFFVFAMWIPWFVRSHGDRPANLSTYVLLASGPWGVYREAHALRRRMGWRPWFLVLFDVLQIVAILFFIIGIASAVWTL